MGVCQSKATEKDISSFHPEITTQSQDGTKYRINTNGLTFYPTPFVNRKKNKQFNTKPFHHTFHDRHEKLKVFYDPTKEFVSKDDSKSATRCGFINACQVSYLQHYPLLLSPQQIFLLILQGIAIHVDKNAEKLRDLYVDHEEKINLTIIVAENFNITDKNNDWNSIISNFNTLIDKNTKNNISSLYDANFSCSTITDKLAAKITLMSTTKNYFSFGLMRSGCGFPEITLNGTQNDWILLKNKVDELLSQFVIDKFGEKWKKSLLPILDKFIQAFDGNISMVFWNSMIFKGHWYYYENTGLYGFGGKEKKKTETFISGWINTLFPYVGAEYRNELYENKWCFEIYKGDNECKEQYGTHVKDGTLDKPMGPKPEAFDSGMAFAPVKFMENNGSVIDNLNFNAGFVGFEQNTDTFALTPSIGWYITAQSQKEQYDY